MNPSATALKSVLAAIAVHNSKLKRPFISIIWTVSLVKQGHQFLVGWPRRHTRGYIHQAEIARRLKHFNLPWNVLRNLCVCVWWTPTKYWYCSSIKTRREIKWICFFFNISDIHLLWGSLPLGSDDVVRPLSFVSRCSFPSSISFTERRYIELMHLLYNLKQKKMKSFWETGDPNFFFIPTHSS